MESVVKNKVYHTNAFSNWSSTKTVDNSHLRMIDDQFEKMDSVSAFVLGISLGVLGTHLIYMFYFTNRLDKLLDRVGTMPSNTHHLFSMASDIISCFAMSKNTNEKPKRKMAPPSRINTIIPVET